MRTLSWLFLAGIAAGIAGQADPAAAATAGDGSALVQTLPQRSGGREIRTPQGFVRIDDPRGAASGSGAFGVYPAGAYGHSPPPAPETFGRADAAPRGPPSPRPPDPCRRERSHYLRRLLRMQGVDLDDPLAVLDGLSGPAGYAGGALFTAYGLLPGVDPIRPLAWDLELRSLARELAECSAAARATAH